MSGAIKKELICINCPMGCALTVEINGSEILDVVGNKCKRGLVYAQKELANPTRMVTSTVKVIGGSKPVVSVKTLSDIPKSMINACMKEINGAKVNAPVKIGDIIIENICDTGVDLIATSNLV